MTETSWWTISGADFLAALRSVETGVSPDIVYAEYYANSDVVRYDQDGSELSDGD